MNHAKIPRYQQLFAVGNVVFLYFFCQFVTNETSVIKLQIIKKLVILPLISYTDGLHKFRLIIKLSNQFNLSA